MKRLTAFGLLGLALGSLLFTSCTAKYQRMLDERDREIVALKDDRSRLEVELRSQKEHEEALRRQLEVALAEARKMADLAAKKPPMPARKAEPGFSQPMRSMASAAGGELKRVPGGTALVLPNSILFGSGSAKLTKRGRSALDRVAGTLSNSYGTNIISVEGHSDSQPIKRSKFGTNWRLSSERAEAVRAYLNKKGVPRKNVRIVGHGPNQPVASNKAESGRRKNRRVEIVILGA